GVAAPADGVGRNLVPASADQMPQRVAAERVAGEEGRVQRQDQAADVEVEAVGEAEGRDRVVGQKDDEEEGESEEEAVAVLQDERKVALAPVRRARLAHRARRRVLPERLVVGAAIVIAGEAEPARRPENQQCCGERQRRRPPAGLGAEQRARPGAEQEWRVERREVRTEFVVRALEGRPCRIDDEYREREKDCERLKPPEITPRRLAEPTLSQGPHRL